MIAVVLGMGLLAFFSLIFSTPPKSGGQTAAAAPAEATKSNKEKKKDRKHSKPSQGKQTPLEPVLTSAAHFKEGKVDDMRLLTTSDTKRNKKAQEVEEAGPAVPTNRAIRKMKNQGWDTKVHKKKAEPTEAEKAEKEEQKRIEAEAEAKKRAPRVPKEKKPEEGAAAADGAPAEKKSNERSQAEVNEEIKKILQQNKEKKQKAAPKSGGGQVRKVVAMPAGDAGKTWDASPGVADEYDMAPELDQESYPSL